MNIRHKLIGFLLAAGMAAAAQVAPPSELVLSGGTVYPSPGAKPIVDAIVVVRDGKIVAIGKSHDVRTPRSATVLDCSGKVIVAGFWNSHVHFETGWRGSGRAGGETRIAHAGHADPLGLYHGLGPGIGPTEYAGAAEAG